MSKEDFWYTDYIFDLLHTGSRVICNPPPTDTDDDWLLLCNPDLISKFEKKLEEQGFLCGGVNSLTGETSFGDQATVNVWRHKLTGSLFRTPRGANTHQVGDDDSSGNFILVDIKYSKTELAKLEEWPDWATINPSNRSNIFHSWKRMPVNLILTCSSEYFNNFTKATKLATQLNLINKPDRVALFEAICFEIWPE